MRHLVPPEAVSVHVDGTEAPTAAAAPAPLFGQLTATQQPGSYNVVLNVERPVAGVWHALRAQGAEASELAAAAGAGS